MEIRTKVNGVGMVDVTCITIGELRETIKYVPDDTLIILQICNNGDNNIVTELSNVTGVKYNEWWDLEYKDIYDNESIEEIDIESRDELHDCITLWGKVYE